MTTNLAISQILPAQRESPMTDSEFTADDVRRVQLMEAMLRDRGYSRDLRYGFWVAPGSRMAAAKVESEFCLDVGRSLRKSARRPVRPRPSKYVRR